jgi:hypothetical protein
MGRDEESLEDIVRSFLEHMESERKVSYSVRVFIDRMEYWVQINGRNKRDKS